MVVVVGGEYGPVEVVDERMSACRRRCDRGHPVT
jgi:hypothetical protein